MSLNYVNKIKANLYIAAHNKTTNLLDGTYKSIYRGKSMNFDNLREYVIGDEVKSIDWKASSRSGNLLVKQFIAEKKHNILVVIDNGKKMNADTDLYENKKELALYLAGSICYIANSNNDLFSICYSTDRVVLNPFKNSLGYLERELYSYSENNYLKSLSLNDTLKYISRNIKKKMIIFVITDMDGISTTENRVIKELKTRHDLLFINVNDNYMFGKDIYDIDNDSYLPDFLLKDNKLNEIEKSIKNDINQDNFNKLKNNGISFISISTIKDINNKLIELLEEHKYASRN